MIQAVWAVGWNYKGLCAAVRLLKRTGHERAGEFEAEAAEFRAAVLAAFRRKYRGMPRLSCPPNAKRVSPAWWMTPASSRGSATSEAIKDKQFDSRWGCVGPPGRGVCVLPPAPSHPRRPPPDLRSQPVPGVLRL